jgi:hypothetical protein
MPWTAFFAVAALLVTQLVIAGLSLYAYNRIRGKEDTQGLKMDNWAARLELAVTTADSAKRQAEDIEVEHFRKLRALFNEQEIEIGRLNGKVKALEAELTICTKKLATAARYDRRDKEKADKEAAQEAGEDQVDPQLPTGLPANPTMEDLRKLGLAVPMSPTNAPAQQPASTFGKVAR